MPDIEDVVDSIRRLEERRQEVADGLAGLGEEGLASEAVREDRFIRTVEPGSLDGRTVAGVDGGLVQRGFHGVDVVLSRAVAALFTFDDDRVEQSRYLPERSPRPDISHLASPLDRHEFDVSSSLLRLQKEVRTAIDAVREQPDAVLLDGSIVPQYMDRPASGSKPRELYDELIEQYQELFDAAQSNDVLLAGVIEDSRGTSLCEILSSQAFIDGDAADILERSQDTNLLQYVLDRGERTCVIRYTEEYEKHPTLSDIGEVSDRIHNFYLKTAKNDRPVRVDFLAGDDVGATADRIASMLLPLCSYSSTYGIPSVVVEADRCAKFSEKDVAMFESRLRSVMDTFPGLAELRRDSRPF